MLRQLAVRATRGTFRRARRQVQARRRIGTRRQLGSGWTTLTVGRLPVVARIDPRLCLPAQADDNLAAVRAALAAAEIDVWRVPANLSRPMLCVRASDRDRVLAALDHPALAQWYRDRLTFRNRRELQLERPHDPLPSTARGIVLWPYVVADPELSFRADQQQGVAITFWVAEPDEATLAELDPVVGPTVVGPQAPQAWRAPVRNGALEVVSDAEVVGLRGDVPEAARGRHLARVGFDVDVVYTWVDGADPAWRQRKLAAQLRAAGVAGDHTERALDDVRFADHEELRHSLRSIEQFAPWVRHVWLVTGGQRPAWLADDSRLTVVDHADIWPDRTGLPSFNSHAIESCLHRIDGLSEHFLYLNDDMILGRPVRPERFFHGSGLPKFFWSNALVDYLPVLPGEIASSTAAKNARRLVADACGVTFSRKFFHAPYPLRVSVLQELEERFPAEFASTRRASFRTVADIAAAGSLYFNYAYATGRSVPGQLSYSYVDPAGEEGRGQLRRLLRRRNVDAFCLNDGHTEESLEDREHTDQAVRDFLAAYLPVPSRFERG